MKSIAKWRWGWKIWIIAAVSVVFGLALWLGSQQSVWFDEAYSITLIEQSFGQLVHLTSVDTHPPLYYLLLKVWSEVFGMSELALRSFSAVCGALAAGVGLTLVRRLFGLRALVISTPLVVLAPFLLRYAFEIRMYALASLIGVAATYVLVRAVQAKEKRAWWWVTYSVLVAAGIYTLYYMAFIWAAHVAWLLYLYFTQKPKPATPLWRQPWVLALVGAVVLYIPWIPSLIDQYIRPALSGISQRVSWEQLTDIFSFMFIHRPHWALSTLEYIVVFLLIAGFVYVVARGLRRAGTERPYLVLLLMYFAIPILIMTIGSLPPLRPMFLMRYTSFFIIAGVLLLGASLAVAFRNQMRYAVIGVLVLTAVLIYGFFNLKEDGNFNYDTLFRPQAKQVSAAIGDCEPDSIVLAGSPMQYYELKYYLPQCDIHFYVNHPIGPRGGYATIYQSPKQYQEFDPIAEITVYFVYTGDPPIAIPAGFERTSSQTFREYHLDIYEK